MSDVFQGQNAEILQATIDGTPYTEQPQSYIAQLLLELKATIEAGGGGGTTNYNALSNKPQINSITLQGNETAADLGLQAALTFDDTPTAGSNNPVKSGGVKTALDAKQNTLIFDNAPTADSSNPVKSGGIFTALEDKQDTLTFDDTPTAGSNNPVKSGGVKTALDAKQNTLTFDSTPTENSNNPVTSGGIFTALGNFYTKVDVDALISAIQSLKKEVVAELPTTDISTDTIYLVPSSSSQTQNVYDEYLYINNAWELIGSTAVDLTNYYTKTEVDAALANKQNTLTFDNTPTASSNNPVKSGGIFTALEDKQDTLTFDNAPIANSNNPAKSGGIFTAIKNVSDKLYSSIAGIAQNNKGSMELYSEDLNDIVTSGFYNAMTCQNAPFTYCALIVCGYYMNGYCFQIAADINSGEIKTRVQTGGTWGSWTGGNSIVYNS